MRQVKAFRAGNHDELADMINAWLLANHAVAISISVDRNPPWFHAFLIYEKA